MIVGKPEIRVSDCFLDFGIGFYTTTSYNQAERWAKIKMRRENKAKGYVSVYEFDLNSAQKETLITRYNESDRSWLDFVIQIAKATP